MPSKRGVDAVYDDDSSDSRQTQDNGKKSRGSVVQPRPGEPDKSPQQQNVKPIPTDQKHNSKPISKTAAASKKQIEAPQKYKDRNWCSIQKLDLLRDVRKLEIEVEKAEREIKRLTRENVEQSKEKLDQGRKLSALQDDQFASSNSGREYLQSDQTIQDNLRQVFDMIARFALEWSSPGDIAERISLKVATELLDWLDGQHAASSTIVMRQTSREKLYWYPASMRVIIEAILNHMVAFEIIIRPFYFLEVHETESGVSFGSLLQDFLSRMSCEYHAF